MKKFYSSVVALGCIIAVNAAAPREAVLSDIDLNASLTVAEKSVSVSTPNSLENIVGAEGIKINGVGTISNVVVYDQKKSDSSKRIGPIGGGESNAGWEDYGTCSFIEDFATSLYDVVPFQFYDIKIQESIKTPGYYRLVNPYAEYLDVLKSYVAEYGNIEGVDLATVSYDSSNDHYIYIHTEEKFAAPAAYSDYYAPWEEGAPIIYIDAFNTGLTLSPADGEIEVEPYSSTIYDTFKSKYTLSELLYLGNNSVGNFVDYFGKVDNGIITFENGTFIVGASNLQTRYYANTNGMFEVKLPGAVDYRITLLTNSCTDANGKTIVQINYGSDVAVCKLALLSGRFSNPDSEIADLIEKNQLFSNLPEPGAYSFGLTADNTYTYIVAGYNAAGQCVNVKGAYIVHRADVPSEWKTLGKGIFTDGILSSYYELWTTNSETYVPGTVKYEVEVQENINKPGYYRLVEPYGPGSLYEEMNSHIADYGYDCGTHYLYIDATNPEAVDIEFQPAGFTLQGDGFICGTHAWAGDKAAAYVGKLANNTITFPEKGILFTDEGGAPSSLYYANTDGEFKVELPDPNSVEDIVVEGANGPAVYYNLQGVRVAEPAAGAVYIKVQGDNASKVSL